MHGKLLTANRQKPKLLLVAINMIMVFTITTFPRSLGLIGRDFARPLTTEEQSAIARQIANGQPAKTQAALVAINMIMVFYHYNFSYEIWPRWT